MCAFVINIEGETLDNEYYRNVIYTDDNIQVVLMNLQPGEDIPEEIHDGTQFIRVESGIGEAIISGVKYDLKDGISVTIPSNTKHYIRNSSNVPLTLYSIYSPPEHPEVFFQHKQPH